MKLSLTTLALLATAAIALPAAGPDPDAVAEPEAQWCSRPGQSCWKKIKRVAAANASPEPEPDADADPEAQWCPRPGQSCWKRVKREAEAEPEPEAEAEAEAQWCSRPGQSCWKKTKRVAAPDAEPEPEPEADADPEAQWCPRPGQSCWKRTKREAEAEAAAEAQWCPRPGQSCWKKVKREAFAEAEPEAQWCSRPGQSCWKKEKREADAEADPEPWCMRPGQSCWKAKRAAEAFTDSIHTSGGLQARTPEADISNLPGGASHMAKRTLNELANLIALHDNDPVSFYAQLELENHLEHDTDTTTATTEKRDALPEPWCMRPGQSCWKRDAEPDDAIAKDKRWCMRPGQSCWKAKRAAEAVLEVIGREPDDDDLEGKPFDPATFAKRDAEPEPWCMRPGQSCWKAKRDIHAMRLAARTIITAFE